MEEAIAVMLLVTGVLERLEIPYLIGGSIASSLHGHARSTQDVDIIADLQAEHVPAIVAALRDAFYLDETAIRDAVQRRATFNVIHLNTMFKVDVFVAGDQPSTRRELERRRPFTLELDPPEAVMVASPEDVIVQKLSWFRLGDHISERQWDDAMNVLGVRGKHLDRDYMRELAAEMEVSDLLARLLREADLEP
jgi:hypothetical protein